MMTSLTVSAQDTALLGAWESKSGDESTVVIIVPGFFSVATYNFVKKEFIATYGGKLSIAGNELTEVIEYDTRDANNVGLERKTSYAVFRNELTLKGGTAGKFFRLDNGTPGELNGAWLITGRMRDGVIQRSTPGVRRTMKILSGTRFQWIAYNVETKEFFGTGGGYYTTEDGKYTEEIKFFSRDSTRVGAQLEFNFSIQDGEWRHQGKSSKGEPLDEIWTLRTKLN